MPATPTQVVPDGSLSPDIQHALADVNAVLARLAARIADLERRVTAAGW